MMSKEIKIKEIEEILLSHGIKMNIGGCGCCGSPYVKLIYNDKLILEETNEFNLEMIPEEERSEDES